MGQAPKDHGDLNGKGLRVGVVTARWNSDITYKLEASALKELERLGVKTAHAVRVPGAFEVPLACKAMIDAGFDAVIALGCVIRGDTTHYETVCNSVERGCTMLQLETGVPVGFGILTVENEEQAYDRAGGKHGDKGLECAQVVVEMVRVLESIGNARTSRIDLR